MRSKLSLSNTGFLLLGWIFVGKLSLLMLKVFGEAIWLTLGSRRPPVCMVI